MKQCAYTFAVTYARCKACNGLDDACRGYTPTERERARRGDATHTGFEAVEAKCKRLEEMRRGFAPGTDMSEENVGGAKCTPQRGV